MSLSQSDALSTVPEGLHPSCVTMGASCTHTIWQQLPWLTATFSLFDGDMGMHVHVNVKFTQTLPRQRQANNTIMLRMK